MEHASYKACSIFDLIVMKCEPIYDKNTCMYMFNALLMGSDCSLLRPDCHAMMGLIPLPAPMTFVSYVYIK